MIEMLKPDKQLIAGYYREHLQELRFYVMKRIGDAAESEDIVQDVFVRLLTMKRPVIANALPCLIFTIARNMVDSYWRHRRVVEEFGRCFCCRNCGDDAASEYSVREIEMVIERGLAGVAETKRRIYRMNVYDGMKVAEISQTLGEDYKRVENSLYETRKIVRNYVKKCSHEVFFHFFEKKSAKKFGGLKK